MKMDMNMEITIERTQADMRELPPWKAIMAAYMVMTAVAPSIRVRAIIQSM